MQPRERVITSLNHETPDRVPRDIGSLPVTGIHEEAYRNYLSKYNTKLLKEEEIEIEDTKQQLAKVQEETLRQWKIDTRGVWAKPGSDWTFEIEEGEKHFKFTDEWGISWGKPKESGYYYDIRNNPLSGDIDKQDVLEYPWPNPKDKARIKGLKKRIKTINKDRRYFITMTGLGPGIYEIAQWLRGYKDLWLDFLRDPELAHCLLEKVTELKLDFWEMALSEVGDLIDTVYMADDIGTQEDLQISLDTYRELVKPYQSKLFHFIKSRAPSKIYIFYHSDGAIKQAIPDLIDAGIDVLNPVQVSAKGMDPAVLKDNFGKEITFWGGGPNPHGTLRKGNQEQVAKEIKSRIDTLSPNGGWVFAPIHNIQPDVTAEKLQTTIDTMNKYGTYE